MRKTVLIFYGVIIGTFCVQAQQFQGSRISEATTLNEVIADIDNVYQGRQEVDGLPKYKKWMRWAYWWSSRVGKGGTFMPVDKLNQQAISEVSRWRNNERASNALWAYKGPETSAYANNHSWCVGNGYGRIDRIILHPTDQNQIYACTPSSGLWHTDDLGGSWNNISASLPVQGVAGMCVDYTNSNRLFLLSGTSDNSNGSLITRMGYRFPTDGIYQSDDHGDTWKKILDPDTLGLGSMIGYRLKMSPLDDDLIVACTSDAILYSDDKGVSWSTVGNGSFTDVEFHPTDENRIYISGFGGIQYSDDKLESINNSTGEPQCSDTQGNPTRIEIAVSPLEPNSVWSVTGGNLTLNGFCGFAKSTDLGETFNVVNNTPNILAKEDGTGSDQTNYDLAVAVDNNNVDRILVGGLTIFRNNNISFNPQNWNNVTPFFENNGSQGNQPTNYVHSDIHDLVFNPLDNSVYAASDGGIHRSTDDGTTWTIISEGIQAAQIYHLGTAPSNSGKLSIGLQDNGVKVRDLSSTNDFLHVTSGDGFEIEFDPNNSDRIISSINNGVYLHVDYDLAQRPFPLDSFYNNTFFSPIELQSGTNNVLYRGANGPMRIITFTNSSYTLSSTSTAAATGSWDIESCALNNNVVYIAGGGNAFINDPDGNVMVSFDGGANFNDRTTSTGWPDTISKVTDVAIHPNNCSIVAFSCGGYFEGRKVYYSVSSGSQWQNRTYNLPNVPVHSVEIQDNGNMYAGTEIGVFYLPNGTTSWIPFYNNMTRVPISDLEIDNAGNNLIAATFGTGVWQTPLPASCAMNTTISGDIEGSYFKEASQSVTVTANLTGGVGTKLDVHGGQKIEFKPGFKSTPHSKVYARLVPCGTGVIENE